MIINTFTNRSFSHDVTAAIFVYKKILLELYSFHMLNFLLFQAICKAVDHVTEKRSIRDNEDNHNHNHNQNIMVFICVTV